MTEKVKEETKLETQPDKKESIWTSDERKNFKTLYGCEIVVEDGSVEQVNTKKAPTDSYVVKYVYEDKLCYDLTRGAKTNLFDMYWDKFKVGLQSIEYGNGNIKPSLWGYKAPQQKKKRKP